MKKIVFSGIQPSGNLHIGNYIGSISQWINLQRETEAIFCIVDLHAITVRQNPKELREKILELAALYLAAGIDPKLAKIFVQSENQNHTYLAWILDCVIPYGSLLRMTQFKDKSKKQKEGTSVGLFNYPALMAADILLYDTDLVPVGDDQKQHLELTRDVAQRFNKTFGQVFKIPQPLIQENASRIMSLQNPLVKMSKSDKNPLATINLLDSKDAIFEKIKKAVTDSGEEIVKRADKPAISNLLNIYSSIAKLSIEDLESRYRGKGYEVFKNDLAEVLIQFLLPLQKRYFEIRENTGFLNRVLDEGRDFAIEKSSVTIRKVNSAVGLGR